MKKAKDIMTTNVITVGPEMTVKEVSKLLSKNQISGAPVMEDDEIIGIISDGDLINQGRKIEFPNYVYLLDSILYLESFKKFETNLKKMIGAKVKDVMTKEVITVSPETTIGDVATILAEEDIKRVPVIEEDELIGIISRGDIVAYLGED